jgi:hypothetical protein
MTTTSRLKRTAFLACGIACYLAFLVTILYAIGFVGNFWRALGWRGSAFHSMDVGSSTPLGEALVRSGFWKRRSLACHSSAGSSFCRRPS